MDAWIQFRMTILMLHANIYHHRFMCIEINLPITLTIVDYYYIFVTTCFLLCIVMVNDPMRERDMILKTNTSRDFPE